MLKLLFCDMDGVIATEASLDESGEWGISEQPHKHLGYIIEKTDCLIVMSSSWRKHTVEATKQYMAKKGFAFVDRIIGVTIRGYHHIEPKFPMSIPRGVEIKHWIDNYVHRENHQGAYNKKELGKDFIYVILDDDTDMLLEQKDYFINTESVGLTLEQANRAIEILNGCAGNQNQ